MTSKEILEAVDKIATFKDLERVLYNILFSQYFNPEDTRHLCKRAISNFCEVDATKLAGFIVSSIEYEDLHEL
jgi:methyl coenzyme M reductase gamma subunit